MSFFSSEPNQLDDLIRHRLGPGYSKVTVHTTIYPGFRFPDLHKGVNHIVKNLGAGSVLKAQSHENLTNLLHSVRHPGQLRPIVASETASWSVNATEENALIKDGFWIVSPVKDKPTVVMRLRYVEHAHNCILEVGSTEEDHPLSLTTEIEDYATAHSIFRGQMLHFSFQAAQKDGYGDVEKPERLQVTFSQTVSVGEADIILSSEVKQLLQRNIIDLVERREILEKHNVPTRRGVLLYGPPGTGKTFACRHICNQLPGATKIFVTGASLGNVGAIFTLARLLQPAIVFIEDADMMFASREINLYSSALGELMDQLDGLRPREDVSVVMTTNSIDRIESALKDRPGRISQCIFMGAPKADLRHKLLTFLLDGHQIEGIDMDKLVRASDGASQAFLKEWVHRSVQVGCERLADVNDPLCLEQSDFQIALDEMHASDSHSDRIVGFVSNRQSRN